MITDAPETKRSFLTLFAFLLCGAFTLDPSQLIWSLSHRLSRPPSPRFQQCSLDRVIVSYPAEGSLSRTSDKFCRSIASDLFDAEKEIGIQLPAWKVFLYNTWEEKGSHVEDIRIAHADSKEGALHYVQNQWADGRKERFEFQILLQQRYGNPANEQLGEAASIAFSGLWNQKTLDEWTAFLLQRNLGPRIPDFLKEDRVSVYWRMPWTALFLRFVKEQYGMEAMIRVYKTANPPANYEERWNKYVASRGTNSKPWRPEFKPEFQKGISYAYTNSYNGGYATKKSQQSLDALKGIGVNWVAAIPYGFMRSANSPDVHQMGHSIYGESDESMYALRLDATNRGMKVMMKPQIWISHSSWPGKVDFATPEQWEQWFRSYENWIVHYAILSELIDVDLLCIGTEFVQATTKHPESWRQIIRRIRQIYHGPLVYAANYGIEFEQLTFWNDLDYMGLDNYYPVRNSSDQGIQEIRDAFRTQKDKLQAYALRHKKPLLFTEIGYMANRNAGMGSREWDSKQYDEEFQKLCYLVAMETYWNEPWFSGMYWWKWFSDPSDQGKEADLHSPHGRPAEAILKQWYTRENQNVSATSQ